MERRALICLNIITPSPLLFLLLFLIIIIIIIFFFIFFFFWHHQQVDHIKIDADGAVLFAYTKIGTYLVRHLSIPALDSYLFLSSSSSFLFGPGGPARGDFLSAVAQPADGS